MKIRNIDGKKINLNFIVTIARDLIIFLKIAGSRIMNKSNLSERKETSKKQSMLSKPQQGAEVMHSTLIVVVAIT